MKEISSVNPIGDFKKMVSDRKVDLVETAINQMQTMIERYVKQSLKGDLYGKAIECLAALRETCVVEDEAVKYNDFLKRIKRIFGGEVGNSHSDFYHMLRDAAKDTKLSLITDIESATSSIVTENESKKFFTEDENVGDGKKEDKGGKKKKQEEEDLMDELE